MISFFPTTAPIGIPAPIAFPNVACMGVHEAFDEGDELELDLETATVKNLTRNTVLTGQPYTGEMIQIIKKGGLMNVLKERMAASSR